MREVLKNGVLNKSSMRHGIKRGSTKEVNYGVLLKEINTMWHFKNYLDLIPITKAAKECGRELTHSGLHYDYLRMYHCKYWKTITPALREELAAVTVAYLDNSRIGYDITKESFVDILDTPESEFIFTKYSLSKFHRNVKKIRSVVKNLVSKLLKLFKKKKA